MGYLKKRTRDFADASLRSASFARRIFLTLLAIPSERTGGVAVANAAKNAREAFFFCVDALFLSLPLIAAKHTHEAVAGYGTSGSFASICRRACDSNAARPALGGMASDEKQMRRAKQRREAPHLRYLRFLFSSYPLTTNSSTPSRKTTKYFRHITFFGGLPSIQCVPWFLKKTKDNKSQIIQSKFHQTL